MPEPSLVLFSTDRPGWTFENIANQLAHELSLYYSFKVMPYKRIVKETCSILVNLWWATALRVQANVQRDRVVTCVYDVYSWNIDEGSRHQFKLTLQNSDGLILCSEQLLHEMEKPFGRYFPKHVAVIPDGVDTTLFAPTPLPQEVVGGWTGNSTRHTPGGPEDHKGLNLIKEAQVGSGTPLNILDAAAGGAWPLSKMPEFYRDISFLLCASIAEGTPNPVLEALACGRPVVTTAVGIVPQIVRDGVNGLIIERSVASIQAAIAHMKGLGPHGLSAMSGAAVESVKGWSWIERSRQWREFLQTVQYAAKRTMHFVPDRTEPAAVVTMPAVERELNIPPHVLLVSDVPDWAFHQNLSDLAKYLKDDFDFTHWFVTDYLKDSQVPAMPRYDCVFIPYHRWPIDNILPWDRTVGSLRALWFYPEKPRAPGPEEYKLVNKFRAFHVVTQQNYEELAAHCPNVMYLTNPVDVTRFKGMPKKQKELIVSWNGNAKHYSAGQAHDVKGFNSHIKPACAVAQVKLEYAEYNTKRLAPKDMPAFYKKANVAICASMFEGASNSVMEAMAAGQAVLATDVGNHAEMRASQLREYGETGIKIIGRNVPEIVREITELKKDLGKIRAMGELNKQEIADRWSWDVWAPKYKEYLLKGIKPERA